MGSQECQEESEGGWGENVRGNSTYWKKIQNCSGELETVPKRGKDVIGGIQEGSIPKNGK